MHELSVTTNILNMALKVMEEQGFTSIKKITLTIGKMNDYEDKWLQKYFNELSGDTAAKEAKLVVNHAPITFKCRDCEEEFEFNPYGDDDCTCPGCGGINYKMISGKQFLIESMECE